MNSIQCEAYEIAGMVAAATFHGWRVNVLTDGSVNFDPPDGERDAGEIRKVRARLLLAAFLAKEQFLGHHDEEAGTAACDAAARELAAAFDTEIDLWRHLVAEGEKVRAIMDGRASQIDQLAAFLITSAGKRH